MTGECDFNAVGVDRPLAVKRSSFDFFPRAEEIQLS
jgi:hypothetical protein